MVDFQTYQKTIFLINNLKKQLRAVDADHKYFLLESQLSVWVKVQAFILFTPNHLPTHQVHMDNICYVFRRKKIYH